MDRNKLNAFRREIWKYYRKNKRNFPWRRTHDPYQIMVSEFMLQQTQVSRVVEKYKEFLRLFPTLRALASATTRDVLRAWQGLGYNRRALSLKKAAEEIVRRHSGRVPKSIEELDALPGIGSGTAGAIVAFAFNMPVIFIETNIRRVFIHFFFARKRTVSDVAIMSFIEAVLDPRNPREWYYALMDYGAMLGRELGSMNPNRKSVHYAKQSRFAGSDRELRGKILKLILEVRNRKQKILGIKEIAKIFQEPISRVKKNFQTLKKEGFFVL